jgi:dTDP-4-dehydrorhamnose reductase
MKILITGANGMVARATAGYCRSIGDEVIALPRAEFDISFRSATIAACEDIRPDAIINCAAFTDVDGSELESDKCFAANSLGPENLALAARAVDARFVTISTDYVFDGQKPGFYDQRDTPAPISVYGQAKLEGEIRARNAYARSIIVRSGWIFGHGGTNFLSIVANLLSEGKSIKAINDAFGTPTFADDLGQRLRELAELDKPCVFHVTNAGNGSSYAGFAEKICNLMGYDRTLLETASSSSLTRPAPRPANSRLACLFSECFGLKPLPHWEQSIETFLR